MSIPESVIEAAKVVTLQQSDEETTRAAIYRARRVFLALAEEMPADAVAAGFAELHYNGEHQEAFKNDFTDAIAAFLKHVAGDSP